MSYFLSLMAMVWLTFVSNSSLLRDRLVRSFLIWFTFGSVFHTFSRLGFFVVFHRTDSNESL